MKEINYQSRIIWLDLLRILAAFFVVNIHVLYVYLEPLSEMNHLNSLIYSLITFLISSADPIFFMLSGSMFLSSKKEYTLKTIVKDKVFRLLIAFFFWSFIYSFISNVLIRYLHGGITTGIITSFIKDFFTGYNHMWFIYALIFVYLSVPFLKKICEKKENQILFLALSSVSFILSFLNSFYDFKSINIIADQAGFNILTGYVFFFVLGNFLYVYEIPFPVRFTCYGLTVITVIVRIVFQKIYEYLSLPNGLIAVSIFLIFKYLISKINFRNKSKLFIVKLSSLTFGTYLSHQVFIIALSMVKKYLNPTTFLLPFLVLIAVVVFSISLIFTWIISRIPVLKKYII